MPVFDFNGTADDKAPAQCTYTTYQSSETAASADQPILILDNRKRAWKHHSCGVFTNPVKRTAFEFKEEDGTASADILKIDARFASLLRWLGENHINVRLSGENRDSG
ncbi:MAG: ATP-dependent Lon protease, partial [Clostridium sp.]|nr:ATP-dependent Lon protease [Clostridium sp.]